MSVIQNIEDASLIFTSQLNVVTLKSTARSILLILYNSKGNGIYENRYYPLDGEVEVMDLSEIVERDMIDQGKTMSEYSIGISSTDGEAEFISFYTVFCRDQFADCTAAEFCKNRFLTTSPAPVIPYDGVYSLECVIRNGIDTGGRFIITRITESGELINDEIAFDIAETTQDYSLYHIDILPKALWRQINKNTENPVNGKTKILKVVVQVTDRYFTVYVRHGVVTQLSIQYRNIFNVMQVASMWADTTANKSIDMSIARIGRTLTPYNREIENEYESLISLPFDDAMELSQIIEAEEVRLIELPVAPSLVDFSDSPEIIITDWDADLSEESDEITEIKLKWQYQNSRGVRKLHKTDRVFDKTYNYVYS